jgi:hypothetical protein
MPTEIVEHLTNGVVVRLGDGTEVKCAAITLAAAIKFFDLYDIRTDETRSPVEHYRARVQMCREFFKAYPALGDKITMEDVDNLLPGFFWAASGAVVPALLAETGPTGTPPSKSTPAATSEAPT